MRSRPRASFDSDFVQVEPERTLGMGYAEISIRIRKPNGKFDELLVHSMLLNSPQDSVFVVYEEEPDEFSRAGGDDRIARPMDKALKITLEGRLFPNEENGNLYTLIDRSSGI